MALTAVFLTAVTRQHPSKNGRDGMTGYSCH
jgi:hypothetical protein